MDVGGIVFFTFLAAIIIVPQVLRYQERGRLHDTLRMAFERGQPVPPELIAALRWGRRRGYGDYDPIPPEVMAGWQPRAAAPFAAPSPAPAADAGTTARPVDPVAPAAAPAAPLFVAPAFISQPRRDFRRGVIWMGIGLGLMAAGVACYAGLYDVGGAQETLSLFAAFGAIPLLVGLTYLALAWFGREKSRP